MASGYGSIAKGCEKPSALMLCVAGDGVVGLDLGGGDFGRMLSAFAAMGRSCRGAAVCFGS